MRGRWKLIMIFESWASSFSHIHQLMIVQSYTLRNTILLVHIYILYNQPLGLAANLKVLGLCGCVFVFP